MKTLLTTLLAVVLLAAVPFTRAEEPKKDAEPTLPELSLEMQALRTLYNLRLSTDQMKTLAKLAKETAEPTRKRNLGKASDEYRKALIELRDALADGSDDEKIADLEDAFADLEEKEHPEADDSVEITAAARKRAPEVFKKMPPSQVAGYLGFLAEDMIDPQTALIAAMKEIRGIKNDDWKDKRDDLAEELGYLLGGVEEKKAKKVSDAVIAFLNKVKALNDDQFGDKKAKLEQEAEKLVSDVGPEQVLRNKVEHTLADLLSNPRLAAALALRLKEKN